MRAFLRSFWIWVLLNPLVGCGEVPSLADAVNRGDLGGVEALLESGVDPNQTDASGRPALIVAVTNGLVEIAKALVVAGANVEAEYAAVTPLMFATVEQRCDPAMIRALLEAGARHDVSMPVTGSTPLLEAAATGVEECVELLLAHGADQAATTTGRATLLHQAVLGRNTRTIQRVVDMPDVDVNATDVFGVSGLAMAAVAGDSDAARILLHSGADPCLEDYRGRTARDVAIEAGHDRLAMSMPACSNEP